MYVINDIRSQSYLVIDYFLSLLKKNSEKVVFDKISQ